MKTATETNKARVLRLLQANGELTVHHYELGKGFRLAARIEELRRDGHVIETQRRPDKVCVYRLRSPESA